MADSQIVEAETPQPVPVIAGNFPDPDAQVLDDQIESAAEPPGPASLPTTPKEPKLLPRKPLTRMLTGSVQVLAGWDPFLLLPYDPERLSLQIWCTSATAGDYIRISDDRGKVQSDVGSAKLHSLDPSLSALGIPTSDHNGPVWISAGTSVGPITVSYIAVTL